MSMNAPGMEPWFSQIDGRLNELSDALHRIETICDALFGPRPRDAEAKQSESGAVIFALRDRLGMLATLSHEIARRLEELVPSKTLLRDAPRDAPSSYQWEIAGIIHPKERA